MWVSSHISLEKLRSVSSLNPGSSARPLIIGQTANQPRFLYLFNNMEGGLSPADKPIVTQRMMERDIMLGVSLQDHIRNHEICVSSVGGCMTAIPFGITGKN